MNCNNYSMNNRNNKNSRKVSRRRRSQSKASRGSKAVKAVKSGPKKVSRRRSGKRNRKSRGGYVALPTLSV